jgi:hypothetical protein
MIKLSVTSKLDGIKSWSLQAIDTCPGSKAANGELVPACQGCYATTGNYRFSNVKAPRLHNREDFKRADWVQDMVKALDSERYFRWLDSGDLFSIELAEKVYQVMVLTPWVKHWLPTRMEKFPKFKEIIAKMRALENVSVRFSSDSVTGEFIKGVHGSVITPTLADAPAGTAACLAFESAGKCNGCRKCWDKSIETIAYIAHGKPMQKVIKLQLAA